MTRERARGGNGGSDTNGGRHEQRAEPELHQHGEPLQRYGTLRSLPIALGEDIRRASIQVLEPLLADSIVLRDLYKKSHWQVAGPTFHQLHLLYDRHYEAQVKLVDQLAERIQLLGGVGIATAQDVAETTTIPRAPRDAETPPVQISRLLDAHEAVLAGARKAANDVDKAGDAGTNDLLVSHIIRKNEQQVWFLAEHLVNVPLVHEAGSSTGRTSHPRSPERSRFER